MTVLQDDRSALALQALAEVTDPASVGELLEVAEPEPGVRNLVFACRLPGYIAWRWTVSTARVGDGEPTVLEVELLPGDGALVAPPWVPWADRLAEYRRTHPDEAEDVPDDLDDEDDDEDLDEVDPDALEIDGLEFEDVSEDEDEPVDDEDGEEADDAVDDEPADEQPDDPTPADEARPDSVADAHPGRD